MQVCSAQAKHGPRFLPSWATQACGCVPYAKVQLRQLCAHEAHPCGAWLWVRPSYVLPNIRRIYILERIWPYGMLLSYCKRLGIAVVSAALRLC